MPCIVVVRTQFWVLRRHLQNKEKGCKKNSHTTRRQKVKQRESENRFPPLFIDVTTSKGIFNTESHTPSQTHKQTVTNGKAESNSQSSHN